MWAMISIEDVAATAIHEIYDSIEFNKYKNNLFSC